MIRHAHFKSLRFGLGLVGMLGLLTGVAAADGLFASNQYYLVHIDKDTGATAAITDVGLRGYFPRGFAYDEQTDTLYASTSDDMLVTVNQQDGFATPVAPLRMRINGLAFDPQDRVLFGVNSSGDLYRIDPASGEFSLVTHIDAGYVQGLAFDAVQRMVYGITDSSEGVLVRIDAATGDYFVVGTVPFDDLRSLTYDPTNGVLWTLNGNESRLIQIDPETAESSYDIVTGHLCYAMAFNTATGKLFTNHNGRVREIDVETKDVGNVGSMGVGYSLRGLTFDTMRNTLYAGLENLDELLTIDPMTGRGRTYVQLPPGVNSARGLAYSPGADIVYGLTSGETVLALDPSSRELQVVGEIPGFNETDGLAYDSTNETLVTIDVSSGELVVVDPQVPSVLATHASVDMRGLAYDVANSRLIGANGLEGLTDLFYVDADSGNTTPLANAPATGIIDIAFNPDNDSVYGASWSDSIVYRIEINSGSLHKIAKVLEYANIKGMAYDVATDTVFAVSSGDLVAIDTKSLEQTFIGYVTGGLVVGGLAFDQVTRTLYATDTHEEQLVRIDTVTAESTTIGNLGFSKVEGLVFDPAVQKLLGTDTYTDQLIQIDPITGQGEAIGPLGFGRVMGLTMDPGTGTLYALDTYGGNKLLSIDKSTGAATVVGTNGFSNIEALAFVWSDCNDNGVPDEVDIATGTSLDANANGVPDESDCDSGVCVVARCAGKTCTAVPVTYGDVNADGSADVFDILCVLDGFAGDYTTCPLSAVDIAPCTSDGLVDVFDILAALDAFAGQDPCNCPARL